MFLADAGASHSFWDLGVLVNYVDRVNLSVSQSALHDEFGISTITFGYLLSAYSLTYAMLQLPVGVILDRFGVKIVGRISTFLWSVASFAAALSTGVASLFSARLLLGIGEAPTFPANAKATGYWFPKEERSFATSIFDAAAKLAPALGRSHYRGTASAFWLAKKFCLHRSGELCIFPAFLLGISQPQRRRQTYRGRTSPDCGRGSHSPKWLLPFAKGSLALVPFATTQDDWPGPGLRVL